MTRRRRTPPTDMQKHVVLAAAAMVLSFTAPLSSQEPARLSRVGILNPNTPAIGGKYVAAFRDEPGRLGYSEGRNVSVEVRYAAGEPERLRALARELADLKVDVIVAPSEPALLAAKEAGRGVPIVAVSCDP
jgi:putative tryptophan/tyrosine transport system substrate-binding protein